MSNIVYSYQAIKDITGNIECLNPTINDIASYARGFIDGQRNVIEAEEEINIKLYDAEQDAMVGQILVQGDFNRQDRFYEKGKHAGETFKINNRRKQND